MSLLKDFSPKRTRIGSGSQGGTKLPEIHSSPVQEIKRTVEPDLIEKYAYHPDDKEDRYPEELCSEIAIAPLEQQIPEPMSKQELKCPEFSLYELKPMCEQYLLNSMYGIIDTNLQKINTLNKEYLRDRLEAISEYKKEVSFGSFKDQLYYYKGKIIITEDIKHLSGFLREYFKITKVVILYETGEILLEDSGYCSFWNSNRLNKFFSGSLRELSHTEVKDDNNCLDCLYCSSCSFSRIQHRK